MKKEPMEQEQDEIHIHVVRSNTATERAEAFTYQAAQEWLRAYDSATEQSRVGNAFLAMAERLFWKAVANSE